MKSDSGPSCCLCGRKEDTLGFCKLIPILGDVEEVVSDEGWGVLLWLSVDTFLHDAPAEDFDDVVRYICADTDIFDRGATVRNAYTDELVEIPPAPPRWWVKLKRFLQDVMIRSSERRAH